MRMYPEDFKPDQKVWFLGRKARVLSSDDDIFRQRIKEMHWDFWAVPIHVGKSGMVCIAHVDDLTYRGKRL